MDGENLVITIFRGFIANFKVFAALIEVSSHKTIQVVGGRNYFGCIKDLPISNFPF